MLGRWRGSYESSRCFSSRLTRFGGHPGVEFRANLKSISHRCNLFQVAFVWELTQETIHLALSCLQGGCRVRVFRVVSLLLIAADAVKQNGLRV